MTATWDAMPGATRYVLEIPRTVPALYIGPLTSYSLGKGAPSNLDVRACNPAGCSWPSTFAPAQGGGF